MPSQTSLTSDFDYLKILQDNTITVTTATPSDGDFAFPVDPFGGFGSGEQGVVTIPHKPWQRAASTGVHRLRQQWPLVQLLSAKWLHSD